MKAQLMSKRKTSGIAVSAAIRCEYCIAAQIEFAKKAGANNEEIKAAIQMLLRSKDFLHYFTEMI